MAATPEPPAQPAQAGAPEWSVLMARAQAGDAAAYRMLLGAIAPYLRAIASRAHANPSDAEDTVQDILLTVHAVRHTYDPARPFKPWLAAIARHRVVDRLRQQGRTVAKEVALAPEHETLPCPPANENVGDMMLDRQALAQALGRLPEGQRQALTMLKLKEMSLQEASATSGMSVPALKVATHRGIKALRRLLGHPGTRL